MNQNFLRSALHGISLSIYYKLSQMFTTSEHQHSVDYCMNAKFFGASHSLINATKARYQLQNT